MEPVRFGEDDPRLAGLWFLGLLYVVGFWGFCFWLVSVIFPISLEEVVQAFCMMQLAILVVFVPVDNLVQRQRGYFGR